MKMEDIWEKAFGSTPNYDESKIKLEYTYYHKMNKIEIKNYMYSHTADQINKDTLYNFFGPNIYEKVENTNHYFIHEIFYTKFDIDRTYKALEAVLNFLSPNLGEFTYGENYMQIFLFYYRFFKYNDLDTDTQVMIIKALYELGIEYGLNVNYASLENNTMWHYLFISILDFKVIKQLMFSLSNYEKINLRKYNNSNFQPLHYILFLITLAYVKYETDSNNKIPIIYFNSVLIEKGSEKDISESTGELKKFFEDEDEEEEKTEEYLIDNLMKRVFNFYGIIKQIKKRERNWITEKMEDKIYYTFKEDYCLFGFERISNFKAFYSDILKKCAYDKDDTEKVKTLKRILEAKNN